jgi:DNA-binding LacI/PurR family transcriptional regulator
MRTRLKDIARIAEVSIRTVSLALNGEGRMKTETRNRIVSLADKLEYRPNMAARGLRMRKTFLIGAVFPYLNVSFFNRIIGGIEERCFEKKFDLLISRPPESEIPANRGAFSAGTLDRLVSRKVDGIIASPNPAVYTPFRTIVDAGIPLLQVMTRVPGLSAPFIGVDNELGGRLATQHLIDLGHHAIGFLSSSYKNYIEIQDRYRGFLKALIANGVHADPERISVEAGTLLDVGAARAGTEKLLGGMPELTAIFAPTDYAAVGAIQACLAMGKRVPEDVSVIGYDDVEIAFHQITHPLSTIAQPKEELGKMAFDALFELMATGSAADRLIEPELIVRSTTGKRKGAEA